MADEGVLGWRSVLFVPGSRPDRFEKALASGTDAVCVDLEDALALDQKHQARDAAVRFLVQDHRGPDRVVRINALRTAAGLQDLLALIEAQPSGGTVVIPKIETAEEVCWVQQLLNEANLDLQLVALLETPWAIENAPMIATASRRLAALMFGGLDLSAALGVSPSWEALLIPRSRIVHAAAHAGIPAIDMPYVDVNDSDGCGAEARRTLTLGFTAKMAIHPRQVPVINDAYTPTADEVMQAQKIVDLWAGVRDGVILVDGRMVERPVILAMERILARARLARK